MRILRIGHLCMYFIGDNEYVVLGTNLSQLSQRVFFPDDTARIMRVTKNQNFTMFIDNRFKLLEIHFVNAVYHFKRIVNNLTVHIFGDDAERMVNRWLDNHFVARLGEALQNETDSLYNAWDITDPFTLDFPVMLIMYPFDDTVIIRIRIECVPENLMFTTFPDCIHNKIRCPKIHVGYPKRGQVLISETFFQVVELDTVRTLALDDLVKVVLFHYL